MRMGNWRRITLVLVMLGVVGALIGCTGLFTDNMAVSPNAVSPRLTLEVLVSGPLTDDMVAELSAYGKVTHVLKRIGGVAMTVKGSEISKVMALPFVTRVGESVPVEAYGDYSEGISTWDLDIMNVTDFGVPRPIDYDGEGVYVAVLDTGLVHNWRDYFPEDRIDTDLAIAFAGGGNDQGNVSDPENLWERDTDSHGTHVTSTILGYSMYGFYNVNGVAPMATIIPVKVLGNNGSGWSAMVAEGIVYVGSLKEDKLMNIPVVINMSLGGPALSPLTEAAIDYAIAKGVLIVASAGNMGAAGMGYPGAYAPVISVAASGWKNEWSSGGWWYGDVADPTNPDDFYIASWSSRALTGQDLDITAPGSWVVGPYQLQMGQTSYYYLGGTSMASPHVAGTVALMAQKYPGLIAADAESIIEGTAIWMPGWTSSEQGFGHLDAAAALAAIP
ncbi:MAG: S8 family serine peptidase [Desulfobacteraceae bacterium]|nr:S8 family serine peptidase [Desulfobacteraceae bacterium]